MLILALESSAKAASCALCRDEFLLAQSFQNSALTHSVTLLPMVEDMLKNCSVSLDEVELIAVAAGPGSFTGLRIGVAEAKGLAWAKGLPCAGCSTLESMAWGLGHLEGQELCCCMDARRGQVYAARFRIEKGAPVRLTQDGAVSLADLATEVEKNSGKKTQFLVGDGWELCYNEFQGRGIPCSPAPPHLRYQSAWGVARCGLELARRGELVTAARLAPDYHRLSQAERERLERQTMNKGDGQNG